MRRWSELSPDEQKEFDLLWSTPRRHKTPEQVAAWKRIRPTIDINSYWDAVPQINQLEANYIVCEKTGSDLALQRFGFGKADYRFGAAELPPDVWALSVGDWVNCETEENSHTGVTLLNIKPIPCPLLSDDELTAFLDRIDADTARPVVLLQPTSVTSPQPAP